MFRDGWILVNSVPTHVKTWGGWIEDDLPGDSICYFITGNPGITDFYEFFLETLHSILKIPVWTINHAGNEPGAPEDLPLPSMDEHPELYNTAGQYEHKRQFLKTYLPEGKKVYLIGHSLGGKVAVELMKDEKFCAKVVQAHLVFPTLQHIAQTFNGKLFTSFLQHTIPVFVSLAWVFTNIFPRPLKHMILSGFMRLRADWKNCDRDTCMEGIMKLFTPQGAKSALLLARDEMGAIKDLDSEIYEKHHDKIFVYFGQNDKWAPLEQYEDLKEKHPQVKAEVLDSKFTHSFVLTTPASMAEELSKRILPSLTRLSKKENSIKDWKSKLESTKAYKLVNYVVKIPF